MAYSIFIFVVSERLKKIYMVKNNDPYIDLITDNAWEQAFKINIPIF